MILIIRCSTFRVHVYILAPVLENPYSQKALIEEIDLTELTTALPTQYFSYNFDPDDKCLYIFASASYQLNAGGTFVVTKINTTNWSITQYTMTNTANVQLTTNGMKFAFAHRGFVYLRSYSSPYDIYKFEIGNSANITKITKHGMTSLDVVPFWACNGRIYFIACSSSSSNRHVYIVNDVTNECLKTENFEVYNNYYSCCYTPVLNETMLFFCSIGNKTTSGFFTPANYLATINNLSEPVTKTADKTMKITYIIQEQ